MRRLRKLENVPVPGVTNFDVVFVKVGQTRDEAIRLKHGEDGAPEGAKLLVVQFVAPDREKMAKADAASKEKLRLWFDRSQSRLVQ